MKEIYISNQQLNNFSKEELNKVLVCFNDGQGDHSVYDFEKMKKLFSESVDSNGKKYNTENMTNSEILDEFYKSLDLT